MDVDVRRQHRLAQAVEQKAGAPVQRAATRGLHQRAQQPDRDRALEQHWHLGRGHLAGLQPRQRTLRGIAPHRLGRGQFGRVAHRAVPGIALHAGAAAGNGCHRHRMPRAGIAATKAPRIAHPEMRLLGRHGRAFAVGHALVHRQRGGLAAQSDLGRLSRIDGPGMEEVELGPHRRVQREVGRVRQAGELVLGGEACDVIGSTHRVADGLGRKVGRAGIAAALAEVDGHAERLVAIALDVLELAQPRGDRQPAAFRHLGTGIAGAQSFRLGKRVFDPLLELFGAVGETVLGLGHEEH
mmetsp:Transcript_39161/g.91872  ORF Transcript_39161/g.91872 Transcript_39161/m.91872 type:complete len:297 (+) Transcript_39161:1012-1902(+)